MLPMNDPINNIQWLNAHDLTANDWNPNVVMNQELKLLELNILECGWVQPILVCKSLSIIDGFHRWSLSKISKNLNERYGGKLPCAVLDISDAEAMMLTVRINRAKGTHLAFKMSDMIRRLVDDHHVSPAEIEKKIGAYKGEVELLYKQDVWSRKDIQNHQYSAAWAPKAEG